MSDSGDTLWDWERLSVEELARRLGALDHLRDVAAKEAPATAVLLAHLDTLEAFPGSREDFEAAFLADLAKRYPPRRAYTEEEPT